MELYVIQKEGKYFAANGRYVNSSGFVEGGADWVERKGSAWGTTSHEHAQAVAKMYGGSVEKY